MNPLIDAINNLVLSRGKVVKGIQPTLDSDYPDKHFRLICEDGPHPILVPCPGPTESVEYWLTEARRFLSGGNFGSRQPVQFNTK